MSRPMSEELKAELAERRREKRERQHAERLARQQQLVSSIDRAAMWRGAAHRFRRDHGRWAPPSEIREGGYL